VPVVVEVDEDVVDLGAEEEVEDKLHIPIVNSYCCFIIVSLLVHSVYRMQLVTLKQEVYKIVYMCVI